MARLVPWLPSMMASAGPPAIEVPLSDAGSDRSDADSDCSVASGDAGPPPKRPRKLRKIESVSTAASEALPEGKAALRQRNEAILAARAGKASRQREFLSANADVLRPFLVDGRVAQASAVLEVEPVPQPEQVVPAGVMRDYQLESLAFLVHAFDHGMGVIIGDEMGLGKTLQTIAFFAHLRLSRGQPGPYLVVCPLSVLDGWCNELRRWAPEIRFLKVHAYSDAECLRLRSEMTGDGVDVIVTTYDCVKSKHWKHTLRRLVFRAVVVDEGQAIKNEKADVTRALRSLRSDFRLVLTGTPVQNNLEELHSLLEFLNPGMFALQRFVQAYERTTRSTDMQALEDVRRLLSVIMLRRLKVDVEKGLPPKHEVRVNCPMSPMQLFWYRRLLVRDTNMLNQIEQGDVRGTGTYKKLLSLLAQLRKACNHPYLFDGAEDPQDPSCEAMVAASGKLALLDRLLVGLRARGHRIVIFSQFTGVLNIIQDYMDVRGWQYFRLDGGTNRVLRMARIHSFQNSADASFFLMTTRAGGLGINLQSADTVVLFDSDWNPQADRQAMARVHRLGQQKPVWVYRLVTAGTAEERILQRAETKLCLDNAVLTEDLGTQEVERRSTDLFALVRASMAGAATRAMSDEELERLLDRSRPPEAVSDTPEPPAAVLHDVFTILGKTVPRERPKVSRDISKQWLSGKRALNPVSEVARCRQALLLAQALEDGARVLQAAQAELDAAEAREKAAGPRTSGGSSAAQGAPRLALAPTSAGGPPQPGATARIVACLGCGREGAGLAKCASKCSVHLCGSCVATRPVSWPSARARGLQATKWVCPQHACNGCGRKPADAGGALLRCLGCPGAWCEACLPGGLDAVCLADAVGNAKELGLPTSFLPIRCAVCLGRRGSAPRRARRLEPTGALDLGAYCGVGDVDSTFAFLDKTSSE